MPLSVVVGVGDVKNKFERVENAIEQVQLMLQVIQLAIKDAGVSIEILQSNIEKHRCPQDLHMAVSRPPRLAGRKTRSKPTAYAFY